MKRIIYKMLLLCCTLLVFGQSAFCKDFRFVQITDLHLVNTPDSKANFENIINSINAVKNVSFVAFTGDNTDKANLDDYKLLLNMASELKVPYYFVVGNHDVFKAAGFSKEDWVNTVRKYNKYQHKLKSVNYVIEQKDFVFIVIDGAREIIPSPGGYYRDETLAWLDKKLKKYEKKNVIMLQHFPMKLRHTERDAYKNDRYEAILSKYPNVIGIFAGHFHANEEYIKDGIFYSITGRASGEEAGYKIVDIVKEENPKTHKKEYNFYTQFVMLKNNK